MDGGKKENNKMETAKTFCKGLSDPKAKILDKARNVCWALTIDCKVWEENTEIFFKKVKSLIL